MTAALHQIHATPAPHSGPVSPGVGVGRAERPRWMAAMQADRQLNARARDVGRWIALKYADHLGWAYPSQARLAADLDVSIRTIKTAVAALARRGWIRVARTNRHQVNRYRLSWPAVDNSTCEGQETAPLKGNNLHL